MTHSSFGLLRTQRFFPLFLTQLLGALNDSLFKNALFILIAYTVASQAKAEQWVALGGGLFILPFFLFSATAGHFADRFDKTSIARYSKVLECVVVALGAVGFFQGNLVLLLSALFLIGAQAAFFGPVKYAILPELLQQEELIEGTALIESSTFLAILVGTLLGGILIGIPHGEKIVSILIVLLAILGLASSFAIPKAPVTRTGTPVSWNMFGETLKVIRYAMQNRSVYLSILGISWFWLVGAIFLTLLALYTKEILHASSGVVTLFLSLFSLGIGIGAYLCTKIQKGSIDAKYVPLGILGITVFIVDLFFASPSNTANNGQLIGFFAFFNTLSHWRISLDLLLIAICSGIYIVPLYTLLQTRTEPAHRARVIAANNIFNALFMVISSVASMILLGAGLSIVHLFLVLGLVNAVIALIVCQLLPDAVVKTIFRSVLKVVYRVKVHGLEHYEKASPRAVIIANHVSFLDGLLLAAFLPDKIVVAVNTHIATNRWLKPFFNLVDVFAIDPANALSMKGLIKKVQNNNRCIIFPEGRITVTGAVMKIYEGPGWVADHADAELIPIRIDGPQYTPFSRMQNKYRLRWFPKIHLTILASRKLTIDSTITGRQRRHQLSLQLYNLMATLMFESSFYQRPLFSELLVARHKYGKKTPIMEDLQRNRLTYQQFIGKVLVLGAYLQTQTKPGAKVGILLPNTTATVTSFFACHASNTIPAMLNYSAGIRTLQSVCEMANIKHIISSKKFLETLKMSVGVESLQEKGIQLIFLEDLPSKISFGTKCLGLFRSYFARCYYHRHLNTDPNQPAVILFTSGSEGVPKGVVLSHTNLQANRAQVSSRMDFTQQDAILNMMPMFHSFGLMAGTLLPLLSGIRVFFYPSPLHYRIIPELIYDFNATILFGTDTFLTGYAKYAHPYDFYSLRYVVAGAEKLKEETRHCWQEKFGLRILEGYGATETSPVLAVNTPMQYKVGSVGCFLPNIEYRLETVPGIAEGGRLWVKGPNIMLGYLSADNPQQIHSPIDGWYDTGDIVSLDAEGFVYIKGRAKRFAKIAGEMVSLTAIENWLEKCWPGYQHAVVALNDAVKGEQLVLVTNCPSAARTDMIAYAKQQGIAEITLPKRIHIVDKLPLFATGKIDLPAVMALLDTLQ